VKTKLHGFVFTGLIGSCKMVVHREHFCSQAQPEAILHLLRGIVMEAAAAKAKAVAKAKSKSQARRHIVMFLASFWGGENVLQVGLAGQGLPS